MNGIMFKESLFNLVVNGTKTMERRVIKPQPHTCGSCYEYKKSDYRYISGRKFCYAKGIRVDSSDAACWRYEESLKSRYKVGETLYLKEPFVVAGGRKENPNGVVAYKWQPLNVIFPNGQQPLRWENPRTMGEKHARYFIEIIDVKVERLQDISDEDCLREGIIETSPDMLSEFPCTTIHYFWDIDCGTHIDACQAYAALIDKIKRGTWDSNPYVFCYSFKLVK